MSEGVDRLRVIPDYHQAFTAFAVAQPVDLVELSVVGILELIHDDMLESVTLLQIIRMCVQEFIRERFLVGKLDQVILFQLRIVVFVEFQKVLHGDMFQIFCESRIRDGCFKQVWRSLFVRVQLFRFNDFHNLLRAA